MTKTQLLQKLATRLNATTKYTFGGKQAGWYLTKNETTSFIGASFVEAQDWIHQSLDALDHASITSESNVAALQEMISHFTPVATITSDSDGWFLKVEKQQEFYLGDSFEVAKDYLSGSLDFWSEDLRKGGFFYASWILFFAPSISKRIHFSIDTKKSVNLHYKTLDAAKKHLVDILFDKEDRAKLWDKNPEIQFVTQSIGGIEDFAVYPDVIEELHADLHDAELDFDQKELSEIIHPMASVLRIKSQIDGWFLETKNHAFFIASSFKKAEKTLFDAYGFWETHVKEGGFFYASLVSYFDASSSRPSSNNSHLKKVSYKNLTPQQRALMDVHFPSASSRIRLEETNPIIPITEQVIGGLMDFTITLDAIEGLRRQIKEGHSPLEESNKFLKETLSECASNKDQALGSLSMKLALEKERNREFAKEVTNRIESVLETLQEGLDESSLSMEEVDQILDKIEDLLDRTRVVLLSDKTAFRKIEHKVKTIGYGKTLSPGKWF